MGIIKEVSFTVKEKTYPIPFLHSKDIEVVRHNAHGDITWYPHLHEQSFVNPISCCRFFYPDPESVVWKNFEQQKGEFANASLANFIQYNQWNGAVPYRWIRRGGEGYWGWWMPDRSNVVVLFLGTQYKEKSTGRPLVAGLRYRHNNGIFFLDLYYTDVPMACAHVLLLRR